jgi:hypothetical protein
MTFEAWLGIGVVVYIVVMVVIGRWLFPETKWSI